MTTRQATSRARSGSIATVPAKYNLPSGGADFLNNGHDALPSALDAPIVRGASLRRPQISDASNRAPEVRSFAERARNLPPERKLPEPPRTSPIEHMQRSASTLASTPNANPKAHSRSISSQGTPNNKHQSPTESDSNPNPIPSEPTAPTVPSNPESMPKRSDTTKKSRDWAPARSPLQKLEVTLRDISKEEKRARVEEAEMLLREAKAGRQTRRPSKVQASPKSKENDDPAAKTMLEPSTLEDAGLTRSLSAKQRERLKNSAIVESKKPSPGRSPRQREGFEYEAVEPIRTREHIPQDTDEQVPFEPEQNPELSLDGGATQLQATSEKFQEAMPKPSANQFAARTSRESSTPKRQGPQSANAALASPLFPVQRSNSRKLQKPPPSELLEQMGAHVYNNSNTVPTARNAEPRTQDMDPLLGASADVPADFGPINVSNEGQSEDLDSMAEGKKTENKKRMSVTFAVPPPTPPPLDEWRSASVCRLFADDFRLNQVDTSKAWWEGGGSGRRKRNQSISHDILQPSPKTKSKSDCADTTTSSHFNSNLWIENVPFDPPLFLRCGPLLRFTGIKRERIDARPSHIEREFWRGSIMIATKDSASSYDIPPTLRIFSQPRELLPPPPAVIRPEQGELAPEYVDPIAGLTKLSRNGKLLFVKPVDHIEEARDLSFIENDDGLFEESATPLEYRTGDRITRSPDERVRPIDGESVGKYNEIAGFRLYADTARDVTFWRFNIEIELGSRQEHIAYRINQGSTQGFWIPAKGQSMNIMFHTGNCFSMSVDTDKFSGPDPLWRDALNVHQTQPFHVMIGGGSQIYNDAVAVETEHFQSWLDIKTKYEKYQHAFNLDIKAELEDFYLNNYLHWFSQGLFGMANSQIPMINMWDDHDLIGGFGSYPDNFMFSPVFSGLGNIAFKYYLLFQHQSVPEETYADEPSWILGADDGPFINQKSRSIFLNLGSRTALLAVDCRTERTRYDILSDNTYDLIWNRCHQEIVKGVTKHLLVLISIPVAYPRMAWLGNVTSKVMDPNRSLTRVGIFGSSENKIGSGVGNIDDQWNAKLHKLERKWLIEDLQELAAEKSVRITILGGDANLAAMGQFYSDPKLEIPKDQDYRYMPNVVSSPIANAPLPDIVSDALNRQNKVHAVDTKTMEDMRPIFTHDVDGKPRNNKRLLPRRNWCCIREYAPGSTPIHTPSEPTSPEGPSGRVTRSLSVSRGEGRLGRSFSLSRRFSLRGPPSSRINNTAEPKPQNVTYNGPQPVEQQDSYFPPQGVQPPPQTSGSVPEPRPEDFIRRRTDLSTKEVKQALKYGNDAHHFINLEGGLDITLNCEVSPTDPAGITTPYRVLVPALAFEGEFEPSVPLQKRRWWMVRRKKQQHEDNPSDEDDGDQPNQGLERPHTPPVHENMGQVSSPEGVAQGYEGIDAYKPKKKRFGIF